MVVPVVLTACAPPPPTPPPGLQLFDEIVMVTDGNVCAHKPAGVTKAYPALSRLSPLCVVAGSSTSITLTGNNLFEKGNELVRVRGLGNRALHQQLSYLHGVL